jgi:hypothetical protein
MLPRINNDFYVPTGTNGMLYYNGTANELRAYINGGWATLSQNRFLRAATSPRISYYTDNQATAPTGSASIVVHGPSFSEADNVGMDAYAGSTLKGGSGNVLIGINTAGAIVTGGNQNVNIGMNAGASVSTGDDNVHIGRDASGTSTAIRVVAIGAGTQSNNANNNVMVGYSATGGSAGSNTSVGAQAGSGGGAGSFNLALGFNAAYESGSGKYNIAMGTGVFNVGARSNTTGDGNHAIGGSSRASTTGSYNTAIGYAIESPSLTASNQFSLGGNAINWLTKFSTQNWIFNVTGVAVTSVPNASAALEINGTTGGFLPPRLTTTQRDAISSPAAGLIIYNTTTNKHQGYNGTSWNDFY